MLEIESWLRSTTCPCAQEAAPTSTAASHRKRRRASGINAAAKLCGAIDSSEHVHLLALAYVRGWHSVNVANAALGEFHGEVLGACNVQPLAHVILMFIRLMAAVDVMFPTVLPPSPS